MSKKATEEALAALHKSLADTLAQGVRTINDEMAKGGEAGVQGIKGAPAFLNVARQYLKDNGVEGVPAEDSATKNLLDEMPYQVQEGTEHTSH